MTRDATEVSLLGDWLSWMPDSLVPSTWARCLPLAAWLFDSLRPGLAVEIGTGSGESFRALCLVANHFSRAGRLIGIDEWKVDPITLHRENPLYSGLREFCATRSSQDVSLIRSGADEAVGEFEHESIDFLHVPSSHNAKRPLLDLLSWASRMRPGGVILFTSDLNGSSDGVTNKEWQQLMEWFPAEQIGLSGLVGVAQLPIDGRTPLLDVLRFQSSIATSLFRWLGERIQYRHVFGTQPVSSESIRLQLARLQNEQADQIMQMQAEHDGTLRAIRSELADISERLLVRAREADHLELERDRLLARLASRAGDLERHSQKIQQQYAERLSEIDEWHAREHDRVKDEFRAVEEGMQGEIMQLHLEVKLREDHIAALGGTLSWRLTRGLRLLQRVRMKLARLAR